MKNVLIVTLITVNAVLIAASCRSVYLVVQREIDQERAEMQSAIELGVGK